MDVRPPLAFKCGMQTRMDENLRSTGRPAAPNDTAVIGAQAIGAQAIGAQAVKIRAVGSVAIGALAVGAVAIGAVALGRVVIGRLSIRRTRLAVVAIDELRITRLYVGERVGDDGL